MGSDFACTYCTPHSNFKATHRNLMNCVRIFETPEMLYGYVCSYFTV